MLQKEEGSAKEAMRGRQRPAGDSKTGGPEGHVEKEAETLSPSFNKKSGNPSRGTFTLTSPYLGL